MDNENFQKVILEELTALKEGQTRMEGKIGGLEGKMGGLEDKIGSLENKVDNLDARMSGLENKVDGLEVKIDTIGDKLDEIEAKNATRHLQIESKLHFLLEDNKSIHEILGEHEVSIRTLRRKPV